MSNFPDSQTLTLQQEALRRVREMQQRAKQSVEQTNAYAEPYAWQASAPSAHTSPSEASSHAPPQPAPQAASPPPPQFAQQQNRQQRQMRFAQPNNILSHLFGGGRPPMQQSKGSASASNTGGQRGFPQGGNPNPPHTGGGSGLLDLLRRQGLGDSVSGLGETLQGTISSVSEPLSSLLESFGIDGEKLVILLVMWAIFNEHKENKTLLMALGYLLL